MMFRLKVARFVKTDQPTFSAFRISEYTFAFITFGYRTEFETVIFSVLQAFCFKAFLFSFCLTIGSVKNANDVYTEENNYPSSDNAEDAIQPKTGIGYVGEKFSAEGGETNITAKERYNSDPCEAPHNEVIPSIFTFFGLFRHHIFPD